MGDPRRLRKQFAKPLQMWDKTRVEDEKKLVQEYGLKNRKEIWRDQARLRKYTRQAKRLSSASGEQAQVEQQQLLTKLQSLGLLGTEADLNSVLSLTVKDLLERRLQTILLRKGLAKSMKQARQLITHRHVTINGVKVNAPSYLVRVAEEPSIVFSPNSSFVDENHPERKAAEVATPDVETPAEEVKEKPKAEKKEAPAKKEAEKEAPKEEPAEEKPKEAAEPETPDKKEESEEKSKTKTE